MQQCLVTGGTGFIGRRLVKRLVATGCSVRLISRTPHGNHETISCDFVKDAIPPSVVDSVDTIFYLAGYAHDLGDASSVEDRYRAVNVESTVRLAQLAIEKGVKRFVFGSSVKAGSVSVVGQCMTEEVQGEPEGIYGKTKREAELSLLEIGRKSAMHVSIVRPSLVYGPGVKGNLRLMLAGIKGGWFPPIPEVDNHRSMIHVDDLVRVLCLVANDDRANGQIFIATDGCPYSSRQIYEAMCYVLGKPVPQWSVPKVFFDFVASINDSLRNKVHKLLGDEYYSSEKLQSLGFKAQRSLKEMNETAF